MPATVWAESQAGLFPMPDSEKFQDPYLDPETGILRNLIGARTKESLDDGEGSLSFARLVQLMDRLPKPTGDLAELCAIHRHLFQDLYDWAGQIRVVDIRKNIVGAGLLSNGDSGPTTNTYTCHDNCGGGRAILYVATYSYTGGHDCTSSSGHDVWAEALGKTEVDMYGSGPATVSGTSFVNDNGAHSTGHFWVCP